MLNRSVDPFATHVARHSSLNSDLGMTYNERPILTLPMSLPKLILERYQIERSLGAGGMGEVYQAHDLRLHRTVAIKLLPKDLTNDTQRLKRFEREASVVSKLNHPNILTIYDVEKVDGLHFMVMEFIDGQNLREYLKQSLPFVNQSLEDANADY
jgi:serine/threonine protein kinase